MLNHKINVKRYIGHNCCNGFLSIENNLVIFEPTDFIWESLRFQFPINDLLSIKNYDVFTVTSYIDEYLSSKALNLSTKSGAQYIIGHKNIDQLLNMFKLLNFKYDNKKRIG